VVLAPLSYLQIVFAALYGVVLFGDRPGLWSLAGMALVCASGLVVYAKRAGPAVAAGPEAQA